MRDSNLNLFVLKLDCKCVYMLYIVLFFANSPLAKSPSTFYWHNIISWWMHLVFNMEELFLHRRIPSRAPPPTSNLKWFNSSYHLSENQSFHLVHTCRGLRMQGGARAMKGQLYHFTLWRIIFWMFLSVKILLGKKGKKRTEEFSRLCSILPAWGFHIRDHS